jgi:hypothetical protein
VLETFASYRESVASRSVGTFLGLAGVCASLTLLWLAMRAVLDIGGTCATGGPFEIARPCPKGIGWMFPIALNAGLVSLAIYAFSTSKLLNVAVFAWPALFLSLGWNFLEYGIASPVGDGLEWGFLIPGLLFVFMGGWPLLLIPSWRRAGQRVRSKWRRAPEERREPGSYGSRGPLLLLHALGIAAGILGGAAIFSAVTR